MSFWDTITGAASSAYDSAAGAVTSAVNTVKNSDIVKSASGAVAAVYKQAGDAVDTVSDFGKAYAEQVGAAVFDGNYTLDPVKSKNGVVPAPVPASAPSPVIMGVLVVAGVAALWLTFKKKGK